MVNISIGNGDNEGVGSAQYNWLENDLLSTTKNWIVVVFHEPGYSSDGTAYHHDNNILVQNVYQPLFETYDVQMVFNGHNHLYLRVTDIFNVTYIVAGGGGASRYETGPELDGACAEFGTVEFEAKIFHFVNLEMTGTQIEGSAINIKNKVVDTFILNPH